MSLIRGKLITNVSLNIINNSLTVRHYAIKKTTVGVASGITGLGKGGGKKKINIIKLERKNVPVETDPKKLVSTLCGSNLYQEGGEDVKLKPDSEYPDWLWNLHTGPRKTLDDLTPDSKEYWLEIERLKKEREESYIKWRITLPPSRIC